MQQVSQNFFIDRSVFYTSRLINNLIEKGPIGDKYQLPPVFFIGLLEFTLPDLPTNEYFVDTAICDLKSKEIIYSKLGYKFLVLPNFNKKEDEIVGHMDSWFYLLKHMSELDSIPKFLDKRVFGRIFDIGRVANLNPEEMNQYEISLKRRLDARSVQATHDGLKKEVEESKIALAEKDHVIAEQGNALAEKDRRFVGYLKNQGLTIEQIMQITNLDIEVIREVSIKE